MTFSRLNHFLPHPLVILTFAVTFAYLFFGMEPLFKDPDTPWHLAAGALLLDSGSMTAQDPWSFATDGQPWYIISWMWDMLIELVRRGFGLEGVFVFTAAVSAAVLALIAYILMARKEAGTDAILLTLFLGGMAFIEYATARPHLIGYVCVLLTHFILHKSRRDERLSRLLLIPALMVLWVNNHGSFLVGITLLGAYGLEALITKRMTWFKNLFITGLICLPALLINPYGIYMIEAVLRTLDSVITQYIFEWMPFVFSNSLGISAWFLIFVLMGSFREPSVSIADKIISVLWLLAMLLSTRNSAMFILVSAPMMAISLQRFVEQMEHIRTVRPDVALALDKPDMKIKCAAAAVLLVAIALAAAPALRQDYLMEAKEDPGASIAWLNENASGKNVIVSYGIAGRVIYETKGAVKVFVDGRAGTAYSEEVLKEYIDFMWNRNNWDRIVKEYGVDGILVNKEEHFAKAYESGMYREAWSEVYRDDLNRIYLRKK